MDQKLYEEAIAGDLEAYANLRDTAHEVIESMGNKTILHVESMHGCKEHVLYILQQFGTKDFLILEDTNQETALHLAAYFKHTEVVEVLIGEAKRLFSSTDDPDSSFKAFLRKTNRKKNTALHLAVINHNVKIVKLLVEADPSDIHIRNIEDHSPVYLAAKRGYSDIVKLMCKVCTSLSFDGPRGKTALHAAIKRLHEVKIEDRDVVKVLLDKAEDMFAKQTDGYKDFVGQADYKENTALHLAVLGNHLAVVKLILQVNGLHKARTNRQKKTPLYIAAEKGYKDIVVELICGKRKFDVTLGPGDRTALHAAVIGRDPDCVKYILERENRLVTYGDKDGRTPLHYAAYYKFDSVLDLIIRVQASVRYQSVYGDKVPTPLCVAAKEGHTSTVIQLMSLLPPSSSAAVNCDGRNILHLAADQSDKEMIRCILKHCPVEYIDEILNHKDVDGDTPLHLLIREGCFVPELIKHKKVITMVKNYHNWTPFDMLYFQDYIVGDQLQIKKTFDDILTTQQELYITESLVPPRRRSKKDEEFKIAKEILMKKGLELYKERTSTQIIVTALITTVTFTVGFTMPGGLNQSGQQDEGLVLLSKKTAFRAFMVSDALALLLSTTSLFLYFISSMYRDPHQVSKFNHASTGLNIFSVIAMMLTFITGTYLVLSNTRSLAITISVIGCIFFLIVIVLLIKMFNDRRKVEKFEVACFSLCPMV